MERHINIFDLAMGNWETILLAAGLHHSFLTGKPGPCPICETGEDRFRYDGFGKNGSYYCNQCGAGNGWHLLKHMFPKLNNIELIDFIKLYLNSPYKPQCESKKNKFDAEKYFKRGSFIPGPILKNYLIKRIGFIPKCVKSFDGVKPPPSFGVVRTSAIGIPLKNIDGKICGIQFTVVTNENKFRFIKGQIGQGCYIGHQFLNEEVVGEGFETVCSAMILSHVSRGRAMLSANNLSKYIPETTIKKVIIAADNDEIGVKKALELYNKLVLDTNINVTVICPFKEGDDFNDVLMKHDTDIVTLKTSELKHYSQCKGVL